MDKQDKYNQIHTAEQIQQVNMERNQTEFHRKAETCPKVKGARKRRTNMIDVCAVGRYGY